MKKINIILSLLLCITPISTWAVTDSEETSLLENAKSGILVEASTGEIL